MTDTRSNIINSARDCFLRYGYRRSSMDDIAQTAGVSRPAIYQYFRNKEDLFAHLAETVTNGAFEAAQSVLVDDLTPKHRLEAYIRTYMLYYFRLVLSGPHADELISQNKVTGKAREEAAHKKFAAQLNQLMGLAQQDGLGFMLAAAAEGIKHRSQSEDELCTLLSMLVGLIARQMQQSGHSGWAISD